MPNRSSGPNAKASSTLTDQEKAEYRQALRAMQERTEALDQLTDRHAPDLARIMVALAELTEQRILIDQLIAWVHGADMLPDMTPGAQAIKCKRGATRDPF